MKYSKYRIAVLSVLVLQLLLSGSLLSADKAKSLTWNEVINHVSKHNPTILAGQVDILEKEWLYRQSKSWSNPNIEIELENFGGHLLNTEEEPPELTIAVSQNLHLVKRTSKIHMARFRTDLAKNSAQSLRLDVLQAAGNDFITLLSAQHLEKQAEDFYKLSLKMYQLVDTQVEVGKVSPLILKRAHVLLTEAEITLKKARQRRQDAHRRLALLWFDKKSSFQDAAGSLSKRYTLPAEETLWQQVKTAPEIRSQHLTQGLNKTAVSLEKAEIIPDIEITGGLRKLRHIQGHKWVAALSFQLPLWNWNRGNINAAKYHLQKENQLAKDFFKRLEIKFRETYRQWSSLWEEASLLETKSLAELDQLYSDTMEGYKAGKFSFLEVLDTQQTLNRTRQRYVMVLHNFHLTALKLARMAGTTLEKLLDDQQPF